MAIPGIPSTQNTQLGGGVIDPTPAVQAQSSSAQSVNQGGASGGGDLLSALGGPLVSGGLSLLGGLFQQGSQVNLANTQYQRGVADMEKAGLNPALMYGSGGPAPTPQIPNVLGGVSSSAQSAVQLQLQQTMQQQQLAQMQAQTDLTKVNAATQVAALPQAIAEGGVYKNHPWIATAEKLLDGVGDAASTAVGVKAYGSMLSGAAKNSAVLPGINHGVSQYYGAQ